MITTHIIFFKLIAAVVTIIDSNNAAMLNLAFFENILIKFAIVLDSILLKIC